MNRSEINQSVVVVLVISCGLHVLFSYAENDPWYYTIGAAVGLKPLMVAHTMGAEARGKSKTTNSEVED